jgi:hypothetical protein
MRGWAMGYGVLLVMVFNDNDRVCILVLVGTQVLVFTLRGRTAGMVMVVVVMMASMHDM